MSLNKRSSKSAIAILLAGIIIFNPIANLVHADETSAISELNLLRVKIENDIENNGFANDSDMIKLEKLIDSIESQVKPEDKQRGSSWVDLGKGWRMRLDTPESNGNPKYHVHVYKGNKEVASENADGTPSHGKTLNDVTDKKIRDKKKSNKKWKDFKEKQGKLSQATRQVKSKYSKSQLKKTYYITLAKALVISIIGFALFTSLGAWGAFFALI